MNILQKVGEKSEPNANIKWVLGSLGIGLLVGFLVGIVIYGQFFANSSQRSLSVTLSDGTKIDMQAVQSELKFDSLYSLIYTDRAFRDALIARLADDQIYQITDRRLPAALNDHLCSPIPEEPLEARTLKSKECADLPVANQLRLLADRHNIPFHYVGELIKIGTPGESHQPQPDRAHVCRNSGFRDRTIELTNPQNNVSVTVRATGSYDCTGYSTYPDIQLSAADAVKLFGRPTDKYEEAVAVVLE